MIAIDRDSNSGRPTALLHCRPQGSILGMTSDNPLRSRLAILGLVLAIAAPGLPAAALAQDAVAAWRVECAGDGKTLDCRAVQQMINREDKALVAMLTAASRPTPRAPVLTIHAARHQPVGAGPAQDRQRHGRASAGADLHQCRLHRQLALKDPFWRRCAAARCSRSPFSTPTSGRSTSTCRCLGFGLAFDKANK